MLHGPSVGCSTSCADAPADRLSRSANQGSPIRVLLHCSGHCNELGALTVVNKRWKNTKNDVLVLFFLPPLPNSNAVDDVSPSHTNRTAWAVRASHGLYYMHVCMSLLLTPALKGVVAGSRGRPLKKQRLSPMFLRRTTFLALSPLDDGRGLPTSGHVRLDAAQARSFGSFSRSPCQGKLRGGGGGGTYIEYLCTDMPMAESDVVSSCKASFSSGSNRCLQGGHPG